MKRLGWMLAAVVGLSLLAAAKLPQALHFPLHRFSISPLEGRTAGTNSLLLTMSLPVSGGFAPNVNVVAQNAPPSIADYIAISKREFEEHGMKVLQSNKPDNNTVIFEYTGTLQNRPLHWYAKASLKGREMLLATATATEQQWPSDGAQLRACVDSFQRDGAE